MKFPALLDLIVGQAKFGAHETRARLRLHFLAFLRKRPMPRPMHFWLVCRKGQCLARSTRRRVDGCEARTHAAVGHEPQGAYDTRACSALSAGDWESLRK